MTPVSPQGGFLPPPAALAEHEPAIQEADTQGQAQAQKACPPLPGNSTFQAANPQPKPRPSCLQTLLPEDPKRSPKQIYANELLRRRHICSAEVPLQPSPASLLAPGTLGAGGGRGGYTLPPRFHFRRMRSPPPVQSIHPSGPGESLQGRGRGVGATEEML